jgi:hypothetical protein
MSGQQEHLEEVQLPAAMRGAAHFARMVDLSDRWCAGITARVLPPHRALLFGRRIIARRAIEQTPGIDAEAFAERFVPEPYQLDTTELTLAIFAPQQRQVSVARQVARTPRLPPRRME